MRDCEVSDVIYSPNKISAKFSSIGTSCLHILSFIFIQSDKFIFEIEFCAQAYWNSITIDFSLDWIGQI